MAKKRGALTNDMQVEMLPVDDLYLDWRNPRLAELGLSSGEDQEEILRILWRDMAVDELAYSIATNGYFRHEILFGTREDGKLYVIEGNRRLAAVKLLLSAKLRRKVGATDLPTVSATVRDQISELPVVECDRADIWHYVGFKHVNGPQPWDAYSKAHYVARVHNSQGISLETIAETIGDRHLTVKRLYRGLMALEQAEDAGVFDRDDRWNRRFFFSHLYTGLDFAGFQRFLNFKPERSFEPHFIPKNRVRNLGEVCEWLYGRKSKKKQPLVRSQNPDLRNLDSVLQSTDGVAALRRGMPLETALDITRGDEELFREALVQAKVALQGARGKVLQGYKGDPGLLRTAEDVHDLSGSLLDEMQRMREERSARRSGRGGAD